MSSLNIPRTSKPMLRKMPLCPSVSVKNPVPRHPPPPPPPRLYLSVSLFSHFSGRFLPGHGGLTVAFGHNQNTSPSCCISLVRTLQTEDRKARECRVKGTVVWVGSLAHSVLSRKMTEDLKSFSFRSKNRRGGLTFISIGVFPIYDKNSSCILHIRLFSLHVLSAYDKMLLANSEIASCKRNSPKILEFSVHALILLAYSPCMIKYFFGVFSVSV